MEDGAVKESAMMQWPTSGTADSEAAVGEAAVQLSRRTDRWWAPAEQPAPKFHENPRRDADAER